MKKILTGFIVVTAMFIPLHINAATVALDTFDTGVDGWSITEGNWESTTQSLLIAGDEERAYKEFDFGSSNAYKTYYIIFDLSKSTGWESYDRIYLAATYGNGDYWLYQSNSDGVIQVTAQSDSQGKLRVYIYTASSKENERLYVHSVEILDQNPGLREFEIRKQFGVFGDVRVIGNTVLVPTPMQIDAILRNNYLDLRYASESYSTLNIQNDATILYARLYWQGRLMNEEMWNDTYMSIASQIKISNDNSRWMDVTADVIDTSYDGSRPVYAATADVTSFVQQSGDGKYYIKPDSLFTVEGATGFMNPSDGLGTYGAWVLVVVYEDPAESKARNITIIDGYQIIDGSNAVDISVNGFLTPLNGVVDTKVYLFVGEGDKNILGDDLLMGGATHNTTLTSIAPNSNNTFNSRINITNATRSPELVNNNGIDIHEYNVGSANSGAGIITNNETGVNFRFTTGGDVYFPSLIVFSTEMYLPQLCYDYSIKQDGSFLELDRSAYPKGRIVGYISGSPMEINIYLRNKEADYAVGGVAIKSDVNDTKFDQAGHVFTSNINGSVLIDRGSPVQTSPLCAYDKYDDAFNSLENQGCTNGAAICKGLGDIAANEYVYIKYTIDPKDSFVSGYQDVNETLGLSIKYYLNINGNRLEYPKYELGGTNVPICPPTGEYIPKRGYFNVVERNANYNNIKTQISRKPFDVDIIFDNDPTTETNEPATSDINTTVLVEMIDIDSFGDINASCANSDARVSDYIVVGTNFSPSEQMAQIPTQPADFYNFAVQNAAFRIWYFTKADGTVKEGWSATTTNNGTEVTSISGLYDSSDYPVCSTDCGVSTSVECFECIRSNYAKPLCSRDNFSVRPESYDLRIIDDNQTGGEGVDLSIDYSYDPFSSFAVQKIPLTAGYKYSFSLKALGHDGSTDSIPGYTRFFGYSGTDYNASIIWNDASITANCNDTATKVLQFYVTNGSAKSQDKHDNVGDYYIHIVDKSWTAVDWDSSLMTHHSLGRFSSGSDCDFNEAYTTKNPSTNNHGCEIRSDLGLSGFSNQLYFQDHNVTFMPARFQIDTVTSVGGDTNATFVYMAERNNAMSMSYQVKATIKALGETGLLLSNFVDGCFADDLNITLARAVNYQDEANATFYLLYESQDNNNTSIASTDNNLTINHTIQLEITKKAFAKSLLGTSYNFLRYNFDRNVTQALNPKQIRFSLLSTQCKTGCIGTKGMDMSFQPSGSADINETISFYYVKAHAPKMVTSGEDGSASIFYEIYCNGPGCDKTLLPDGTSSTNSDDPRWWINTQHTSNYGTAGTVTQKRTLRHVTSTSTPTGNYPDSAELHYDEVQGYPYRAVMNIAPSEWLIYNKYDATADHNEFEAQFHADTSDWVGSGENDTTTKTLKRRYKDRKLTW